jgi:hypothetical protein
MRIPIAMVFLSLLAAPTAGPDSAPPRTYVGFDLNTYPGDTALPILRQTFAFAGYWLSPPPGSKENTWIGKRATLLAQGFGYLLLYTGPQIHALKSTMRAEQNGSTDAQSAATAAKREGFDANSIIFLDIEEGGRLPETYHAYLRGWTEHLPQAGFRAGVYCSGMPVDEGAGLTIITADDIRNHIGHRDMVYWVFNDACPPSPGCASPQNPPRPSESGLAYATIWQFAQSPRRKQFTSRCAATYHPDGNCYAPGDKAHVWFLDVNSATTADPSNAR